MGLQTTLLIVLATIYDTTGNGSAQKLTSIKSAFTPQSGDVLKNAIDTCLKKDTALVVSTAVQIDDHPQASWMPALAEKLIAFLSDYWPMLSVDNSLEFEMRLGRKEAGRGFVNGVTLPYFEATREHLRAQSNWWTSQPVEQKTFIWKLRDEQRHGETVRVQTHMNAQNQHVVDKVMRKTRLSVLDFPLRVMDSKFAYDVRFAVAREEMISDPAFMQQYQQQIKDMTAPQRIECGAFVQVLCDVRIESLQAPDFLVDYLRYKYGGRAPMKIANQIAWRVADSQGQRMYMAMRTKAAINPLRGRWGLHLLASAPCTVTLEDARPIYVSAGQYWIWAPVDKLRATYSGSSRPLLVRERDRICFQRGNPDNPDYQFDITKTKSSTYGLGGLRGAYPEYELEYEHRCTSTHDARVSAALVMHNIKLLFPYLRTI